MNRNKLRENTSIHSHIPHAKGIQRGNEYIVRAARHLLQRHPDLLFEKLKKQRKMAMDKRHPSPPRKNRPVQNPHACPVLGEFWSRRLGPSPSHDKHHRRQKNTGTSYGISTKKHLTLRSVVGLTPACKSKARE